MATADRIMFPDRKLKPIKRDGLRVGRNELCPCGSGIKAKKCCIPKYEAQVRRQLTVYRAFQAQIKKAINFMKGQK